MWPLIMDWRYWGNWLVCTWVWVRGLQTANVFHALDPICHIPYTASLISHGNVYVCVCVCFFDDHLQCEFPCWLKKQSTAFFLCVWMCTYINSMHFKCMCWCCDRLGTWQMWLRRGAKKDVEGGSKTRGKFLRTAASVGPCYAFTDSPLMTF